MKCARCGRAIAFGENSITVRAMGGIADFHWVCAATVLKPGAYEELALWRRRPVRPAMKPLDARPARRGGAAGNKAQLRRLI